MIADRHRHVVADLCDEVQRFTRVDDRVARPCDAEVDDGAGRSRHRAQRLRRDEWMAIGELVHGRLELIHGWCRQESLCITRADEEGVRSTRVAGDEPIAERGSKVHERAERSAMVGCFVPSPSGSYLATHLSCGPHDPLYSMTVTRGRSPRSNRVRREPEVVAIHIDDEQVERLRPCPGQLGERLLVDVPVDDFDGPHARRRAALHAASCGSPSTHVPDHPLLEECSGAIFTPVHGTDLHEVPIVGADPLKDGVEDPVLSVLGEARVFRRTGTRRRRRAPRASAALAAADAPTPQGSASRSECPGPRHAGPGPAAGFRERYREVAGRRS